MSQEQLSSPKTPASARARALPALGLFLLLACAVEAPARGAGDLTPTPNTGRGPFFPPNAEEPADNDLRTVEGGNGEALGTPLTIEGRVVDRTGAPVADAEIIVWQVDTGGKYNHPRERRSGVEEPGKGGLDPNFQYWGKTRSDADGAFVVETIVPVNYRAMGTNRPGHVHFELRHPDYRRLATEMNFKGDPNFDGDPVTAHLAAHELAALQVELEPKDPARPDGHRLARWTVVLTR